MGSEREKIDAYCHIDGKISPQKTDGNSCQNDYECESNECSYGLCVSTLGELRESANFVKKMGCRILSIVSLGSYSYEECIAGEASGVAPGGGAGA